MRRLFPFLFIAACLMAPAAAFSSGPGAISGSRLGLRVQKAATSPTVVRRPRCGVSSLRAQGAPMDKEPLDCCEENVQLAIDEAKEVLQTIFGNNEENRAVGITGDVELVDLDGPFCTLRLKGRFWHKRVDVLSRMENYLTTRIPELIEVNIEDPKQLDDLLPENMQP